MIEEFYVNEDHPSGVTGGQVRIEMRAFTAESE